MLWRQALKTPSEAADRKGSWEKPDDIDATAGQGLRAGRKLGLQRPG
jgi:hypothetical protein